VRSKDNKIIFHSALLCGLLVLLVLGIVYPFLPGSYDSLAMPVSALVQGGGSFGLLLVPIGLLWFFRPQRAYTFAFAAAIVGAIIAAIMSLVALFAVGASLGLMVLVLFAYAGWKLVPRLKCLKHSLTEHRSSLPLYLILLPIALILAQLLLAAPLTDWSRNRAMANSAEFIGHIEAYRAQYGRYPTTLLAQHKDYYPDVIGIEKYHYSPQGDSYNLFLEQPRFAFDSFGTREWVVYNPRDEHRMYSHTSWFMLLSPEEQERGQGWYAVHDTGIAHWKSFLFD
jgi:hypothetical protein